MANSLVVVHVHARVDPASVEAFRAATLANAGESVHEPGVARFDMIQSVDDPHPLRAGRSVPERAGRRRPQGNRALLDVA